RYSTVSGAQSRPTTTVATRSGWSRHRGRATTRTWPASTGRRTPTLPTAWSSAVTGRSVSASTVRDLTQNGRQPGLTSLLVDVFVVLALGARLALTQAIEEPHSLRRQAFVVGGKLAAEDEADAEREDRMIGRERFDLGRHSTNDRRPSAIAPDPVASVRVRDWIPQLALLRLQLR